MDKIYVTGHRNPDTDSIVSAMAYATLRNAVGDREYVAARLGHLSDETRAILNRFGFDPPLYITDMRTQVQDLEYDVPPILNRAVTVNRAWSAMEADWHIAAIPITDDEGKLVGMLTSGDIAEQDMKTIADPVLDEVPIFNILSVLEGELLNEPRRVVNTISGRVVIALPCGLDPLPFKEKDTILICGRQPDIIRAAVEQGVGCVILCQAELPENLRQLEKVTLTELGDLSAMAGNRKYALAEDVQVLLKDSSGDFYATSLSEINAEDYSLTGWYDDLGYAAGGRIRILIAVPD